MAHVGMGMHVCMHQSSHAWVHAWWMDGCRYLLYIVGIMIMIIMPTHIADMARLGPRPM